MITEKITSENCEEFYRNLPKAWSPAEKQMAVLYAFLEQNGMKIKPGATAIERMIRHMENYLGKPFKVPDEFEIKPETP